ncbi:Protein FAM91A1 [Echinococcus granulosus]|nr:Protein FAM91A1 [Echinococcus granulosus]
MLSSRRRQCVADHRRKWDRAYFEKLADQDQQKNWRPCATLAQKKETVKRQPLKAREYTIDLESNLKQIPVIAKTGPGSSQAGYYCEVCDCVATLNQDTAEYDVRVLVYFLQNQLEYSGELIRKIVRSERTYYRQLVQYSSQQMMLFPYHLQRKIVPGILSTKQCFLNSHTIDYQILLLLTVFKSLELGRLCSPKSGLIDTPSSVLDELLPKAPRNFMHLQPWFIVRVGSISNADVEANTPYVQSILDRIIDNDRPPDTGQVGPGLRVSEIPIDVFQNLYQRGLIYVEVPVLETDCLFVPTLAGFIMNRVSGDSYETLLYKIFVSLDPQSCVCQLAADLGVGLDFVINAASLFVRLGFACKSDSVSDPVGVGKSQDNASITEPEGTSPSLKPKKLPLSSILP